jgi:hypothetical protein
MHGVVAKLYWYTLLRSYHQEQFVLWRTVGWHQRSLLYLAFPSVCYGLDNFGIRSKNLWRWYINTYVLFLDIAHRPMFLFYLKCTTFRIGTSSTDWVQSSRLHLRMETESSLRNVVYLNKQTWWWITSRNTIIVLRSQGLIPSRTKSFISSLQHLGQFRDPPIFLSNAYQQIFSQENWSQVRNLTTHLCQETWTS